MADDAIVVHELCKDYPKVRAVDGLSFTIDEGEIFGLLGPNGAGKTTTIRLLLTLIKPSAGRISIFGVDALARPQMVRQMAGYVPQEVSIDGELTGYENILMYSRLYGVVGREKKKRIAEILSFLDLEDRAGHLAHTYSGGMMRRLEIAQALVNRPRILFLDEPSIGLDPGAKRAIWGLVKKLRNDFGTTVFINTHDMNEADLLCDRIGIMDRGRLLVVERPEALKLALGGDVLTISSKSKDVLPSLTELGYSLISKTREGMVDMIVTNGERQIPHIVEALKKKEIEVDAVSLKKPSLDDVFLKYTGARIDEGETWDATRRIRRSVRRLGR